MSSRCPEARGARTRHGPRECAARRPAARERAVRLLRLALAAPLLCALAGCEREARRLEVPPSAPLDGVRVDPRTLRPGPAASAVAQVAAASEPGVPRGRRIEENAYAVSQGKRWYRWFNCSGCHASGGGGDIGPPLSDDRWLYGHELPQVVASILEGRPNGMPAFAGRVSEEQAWQLAAYVRSLSGQLRSDVAGGRSDSMSSGEPEQRRELEPARPDAAPPTVR
jgi:cytochrome c oxidase cbb3-type subunit 3